MGIVNIVEGSIPISHRMMYCARYRGGGYRRRVRRAVSHGLWCGSRQFLLAEYLLIPTMLTSDGEASWPCW